MSELEPTITPSLQNRYDQERSAAAAASRAKKVLPPIKDEAVLIDDYAAECEAIPPAALQDIDWDALVPKDFKLTWGQDSKCCVSIIPFDYGGKNKDEQMMEGKWDRFLAAKKFLRLLAVSPLSGLTMGYGDMAEPPGRYFAFLPVEMKKDIAAGGCTFDVEYKEPRNFLNDDDRKWFIRQCKIAYSNLLKLMRKMPAGKTLN